MGFLACTGVDVDCHGLYVLSPLGMRVAMAAEEQAAEAERQAIEAMSPEEENCRHAAALGGSGIRF